MRNLREIFHIGPRKKYSIPVLPSPDFSNNWRQDSFDKNVADGVEMLKNGKLISILDDGRGYELALKIKEQFILEYAKQLSEAIKIETHGLMSSGKLPDGTEVRSWRSITIRI